MSGPIRQDDDPELEDISGLRGTASGRPGLGWVAAFAVLLVIGLALWAYLR